MNDEDTTVVIWRELRQSKRDLQGPVPTQLLADRVGYSDRQMRRILHNLSDLQVVRKVSERGGWLPIGHEFKPIKREPRIIQLELPLIFEVAA